MSQTIQKILEPFLDRVYRKSKSQKAKESHYHAILLFNRWYGKDVIEVIDDLKKGKEDVYKTLDDYVTHLSKLNWNMMNLRNPIQDYVKFMIFALPVTACNSYNHFYWEELSTGKYPKKEAFFANI